MEFLTCTGKEVSGVRGATKSSRTWPPTNSSCWQAGWSVTAAMASCSPDSLVEKTTTRPLLH